MPTDHAHVLPRPGPAWGAYPLKRADDAAGPWRAPRWRSARSSCVHIARLAAPHAAAWQALTAPERDTALRALRQRLRRDGLRGAVLAEAIGVAAATAQAQLGWAPRENQRMAAAALLDGRMAEMATGEGKTLAVALAAAVAALAGMPVHVVTANDYLAQRDAAGMAPLYAALGLRVTALATAADEGAKRAAYAHDIVYATAKELAFDFLRDRQARAGRHPLEDLAAVVAARPGPRPVMRGLCLALLDEADSILLDEAEVPLILARAAPQAARRAFLWQALAVARQLQAGADFAVQAQDRTAILSAAGEDRLATLAGGLGGPWARPRYRREAVQLALTGLYAFRRDLHYLVRDGQVEVLDEVTGRVAPGRVWSRGLHTVLALKEGLSPPPETETTAQTTFQRFFQRYWRLAGISGTLREAAGELRAVYGAGVVAIPSHRRCRRRTLQPRVFDDAAARAAAVAERVAALQRQGRPVLIGSDSVGDSQALSAVLSQHGIAHRVLNALNDADEAAIVAEAGRAGRVTVATRMAGRGTDIVLDDAARAAGGLHVLSCQHNPSRRLDRQLAGRAGRQGDPGSEEAWFLAATTGLQDRPELPKIPGWIITTPIAAHAPLPLLRLCQLLPQWLQERRRRALRRELLRQDLDWERRLSFAGSPP